MDTQQFALFFLIFLLSGVVISGILAFGHIILQPYGQFGNKNIGLMLLACALALAFRIGGAPREHRVYYDEFTYVSVAQNIFLNGTVVSTLKGTSTNAEVVRKIKKPPGFHLLLAFFYSLIGRADRTIPFILNIVLGVLCVALVYRIAWQLFEESVTAWWTAVFLALSPVHILCSTCASADVAGFFFFLLAILFFLEWTRLQEKYHAQGGQESPGTLLFYAAIFSGGYGIYVKPEYIALLMAWLATFWNVLPALKASGRKMRLDFLFVFACFLFPLWLLSPGILAEESRFGIFFSWKYILKYALENVQYLFDVNKMNLVTTIAFLLSFGTLLRRRNNPLLKWILLLFCIGFLIVSGYFAGGLSGNPLGRHFLLALLPFVLLAGAGMGWLLRKFFRYRVWVGMVLFLFAVVSAVHALDNYVDYSSLLNPQNAAQRATQRPRYPWLSHRRDAEMFKLIERLVPDDAYIVYDIPLYFTTMTSRRSLSWDLFLRGDHPPRIALVKGLSWLNQEKLSSRASAGVLEMYACPTVVTPGLSLQAGPFEIYLCDLKR